jgi:hypothetical protein
MKKARKREREKEENGVRKKEKIGKNHRETIEH